MDAWETLTSTSSLTPASSYDAWEHLNEQEGGGGGVTIFADDLTIRVDDSMLELRIDDTEFVVTCEDSTLQATIDDTEYVLEVCLDE
jgi:hypothetical protein